MSSRRRSLVPDFENCPCSGGTLDRLIQPAILAVLAQSDLHGYRIAQRITDMPPFKGQQPDASGVYRFLKSMEEKGFVVASWDVSVRGPAKRLYKLTNPGRECLSRWTVTLDHYRKAIGSLLTITKRACARSRKPRKTRKSNE